jgi:hypothetical protein
MECTRLRMAATDQSAAHRKYREANREKRQVAFREWRAANRDAAVAATKRWQEANKDQTREYMRLYHGKKYNENVEYRLKVTLRNRVNRVLKLKNGWSFVRDLGCTVAELRTHIEAQFDDAMSWDNWGSVWQLDHERPLVSFDLTQREQFLQACHYTNLRPMTLDEHRQKSLTERRRNSM